MSQVIDPVEVAPVVIPPVSILPDRHPTSGMPKNYRVEIALFGGYKRGSIIPKHVVVRSAGAGGAGKENEVCDAKVISRRLSETYEEVNVDISPMKPFELASTTPAPVADVKNLEVKVSGLRADLAEMQHDRDGWKQLVESKDSMLLEQQGLVSELRATLNAREETIAKMQGEIRVLTDTLETATAPKGKQK